jgi:hypothetical protein
LRRCVDRARRRRARPTASESRHCRTACRTAPPATTTAAAPSPSDRPVASCPEAKKRPGSRHPLLHPRGDVTRVERRRLDLGMAHDAAAVALRARLAGAARGADRAAAPTVGRVAGALVDVRLDAIVLAEEPAAAAAARVPALATLVAPVRAAVRTAAAGADVVARVACARRGVTRYRFNPVWRVVV